MPGKGILELGKDLAAVRIFYGNEKLNMEKTVMALGNFDGLHIAHRRIVEKCAAYGRENGLSSGALLFLNHTGNVTGGGVKLLTVFDEKKALLEAMGIDFIYAVPFDEAMMRKSPADFICFLREQLHTQAVSVGYDYRFGFRAAGTVKTLQDSGVGVLVTAPVRVGRETVSSTLIRTLVAAGRVKEAAELLGRPYSMAGPVHNGLQNGRKMGLPTANLAYAPDKLLPGDGVYKAVTYVDNIGHKSAVNVGKNPTFDAERRTVESFILDFDRDIYAENIRIEFLKKIRDEIKFESPEQLQAQIRRDIEKAGKDD